MIVDWDGENLKVANRHTAARGWWEFWNLVVDDGLADKKVSNGG